MNKKAILVTLICGLTSLCVKDQDGEKLEAVVAGMKRKRGWNISVLRHSVCCVHNLHGLDFGPVGSKVQFISDIWVR